MERWSLVRRRASLTALAVALGAHASAQSAPCGPGDSLLSLGKAAFFWSIERGAFAIGERTLDGLADGSARSRAAVLPRSSDEALVSALGAYIESPSSEAADEALNTFLEVSTKIIFETPPERAGETGRVGLVLEERHLSNRGSKFAVQDMMSESTRRNLEASLFGDGPDLLMSATHKLLGQHPFFKAPVIVDAKNLDRNNLGIEVRKEMDLRNLWFGDYRAHLAAEAPSLTAAQVSEALNAGWPAVQKFWAFKRTEIFIDRAQTAFGTRMREVYARVTRENLPSRACVPTSPL